MINEQILKEFFRSICLQNNLIRSEFIRDSFGIHSEFIAVCCNMLRKAANEGSIKQGRNVFLRFR